MLKKSDWDLVGGQSKRIHDQGNQTRAEGAKVEQQKALKIAENMAHQASLPDKVDTSRSPELAKGPIRNAPDTAPVVQKDRAEVAHKSGQQAETQFQKASDAAKELQHLSTKLPVGGEGADASRASRGAVATKGQVNEAHVQQKPISVPTASAIPAQSQGAKLVTSFVRAEKGRPTEKQPAAPERSPDKTKSTDGREIVQHTDARNVTQAGLAAGGDQAVRGSTAKHTDPDVKKIDGEEEPPAKSGVVSAHSAGAGASKGLRNLESGVSADAGGSDGETSDPSGEITTVVRDVPLLPETDPNLVVFNEYDEDRPGIEVIKSKAQVLERYVVKGLEARLAEIAEFDQKLTDGLRPLVERVKTEDPELRELLVTARFITNVYGMT
ncbi:MAG: hypothetical protein HY465_01460 [Deltaproteobacteria bacterium]|nr:hypothetical protein [Deltaproteobacteria bacterium]